MKRGVSFTLLFSMLLTEVFAAPSAGIFAPIKMIFDALGSIIKGLAGNGAWQAGFFILVFTFSIYFILSIFVRVAMKDKLQEHEKFVKGAIFFFSAMVSFILFITGVTNVKDILERGNIVGANVISIVIFVGAFWIGFHLYKLFRSGLQDRFWGKALSISASGLIVSFVATQFQAIMDTVVTGLKSPTATSKLAFSTAFMKELGLTGWGEITSIFFFFSFVSVIVYAITKVKKDDIKNITSDTIEIAHHMKDKVYDLQHSNELKVLKDDIKINDDKAKLFLNLAKNVFGKPTSKLYVDKIGKSAKKSHIKAYSNILERATKEYERLEKVANAKNIGEIRRQMGDIETRISRSITDIITLIYDIEAHKSTLLTDPHTMKEFHDMYKSLKDLHIL